MTTRALTASRPGPVALSVDLPAGDVTVIADPACTVAEVAVTAHGDDPAVHDAVRDAVLRWDEATNTLSVRVDSHVGGGVAVVGGTQTVIGHRGMTVVQSFGDIPAGVTVNGVAITGDGVVNLGGRVVINGVEVTGRGVIVAGGRVEVTAHVPVGTRVAAVTQSAPVSCSGEFAAVDFTSASGGLSAGGVGALRAETTSGAVSAAAVDGAAVVRSVSGEVYLGRAGDVHAATTSGDVTVTAFAGRADVSTVSGDVRVRATGGGTVRARSVSGDITVIATGTALAEGLAVTARSQSGDVVTPGPQRDALA
ncbi:hypothetical protein Acsp04_58790 [Actinomadura sp. NBRC 104425]|uniref:DUF4097 family beta strand repeat-containing protein n=1 Tax=Actinomadura sp. NBRC 104425 TaxID=3032204 RepID=UPI0024A2D9F6|nr:DUF4097 family beta strand repeat-containing protein [Actinomadura sp. NBRC 104425]GLZ15644.1 hypothetical protein Acsp04_58790 [Actinomadura sp. NBRC 104425]